MTIPRQPRNLTLAQQFINLKMNPLTRGSGGAVDRCLTWRFEARPSPISRAYAMCLTYDGVGSPEMFVEEPNLTVLANGKALPHVYSENPVRLCLYLPGTGEWSPQMLLDRTFVPWSILWLWYFEDWLATGEWHGGGLHPSDFHDHSTDPRRRVRRSPAAQRL